MLKLTHSLSTNWAKLKAISVKIAPPLPYAKLTSLVIFGLLLGSMLLSGIGVDSLAGGIGIDTAWNLGIVTAWQQGHVLGRDSFFTYGPLIQMVTSFATNFNNSKISYNSPTLILVSLQILTILSVFILVLLIKQINWKYTIFLLITLTALTLVTSPVNYRVWVIGIWLVGLCYGMSTNRRRWQVSVSLLVGVAGAISQLLTFEVGLYTILSGVGLLLIYALLARFPQILKKSDLLPVKNYLWMAGLLTAGYILGNIAISLVFKLTSPNYQGFFDYQIQSLDMSRGYNNTFGSPWTLGWVASLTLLLVIIYCVWFVLRYLPKLQVSEGYLLMGLLLLGLFQLKSSTIRSDDGHIYQGMSAMIFLYLLLGIDWLKTKRLNLVWISLVLALILTTPMLNLAYFRQTERILEGQISVRQSVQQAIERNYPKTNIVPKEILRAADPNKAISVFPFEYHWAIPFDKPIVSPAIQSYVALTEPLQLKYVEGLAQHKDNLEIIYGLDKVTSGAIDNVYNITRLPRIFEYIYQNFETKIYANRFLLLQPRTTPAMLQSTELKFTWNKASEGVWTATLNEPTSCSLLRLTPKINYPVWNSLGRTNGLTLKIWSDNKVIDTTDLVATKLNESFSTYIPMVDPQNFVQVFEKSPVQTKQWDGLQINYKLSGLFEVNPSSVEFQKIECITFAR